MNAAVPLSNDPGVTLLPTDSLTGVAKAKQTVKLVMVHGVLPLWKQHLALPLLARRF